MKSKGKKITYIIIAFSILIMIGIIIAMIANINRIYSEYKDRVIAVKDDEGIYNELREEFEEASSNIGKTVEESSREEINNAQNNKEEQKNEEQKQNTDKQEKKEEKIEIQETKEEIKPDPTFIIPVSGQVIKNFSKESLVYSDTLKEWTTHNGIDIEAELATVVKASEQGTIKAIKNDPRYGITVIISHVNGYETRYSNLLTAEFVKEGEVIKQGQTIGTVGNTAAFEIADKPHLHFELLKNNEYVDPDLFIK